VLFSRVGLLDHGNSGHGFCILGLFQGDRSSIFHFGQTGTYCIISKNQRKPKLQGGFVSLLRTAAIIRIASSFPTQLGTSSDAPVMLTGEMVS
jgi:hypothetical protein